MSRYKSEQTVYDPRKKKYVPLWRLDTTTPTSSGIIFIFLTANALTGFAGSSTKARSFSTLMIWNGRSMKLSPVRWSFGSSQIVVICKLSSAVIPRRCSVWRTASFIWREKRCLSVWFIFESRRLCLRVQPLILSSLFIAKKIFVQLKCIVIF